MHDPNNQPLNDDSGDQHSLEQRDHAALTQRPESADHRTELYARLRNIIDNATESIRMLKDENAALTAQNAEMGDRIGMLEQRIRAVTADLANDELALRESAEVLEHMLQGTPTGTAAPAAASAPPDPAPHPAASAPPLRDPPASHSPAPPPQPDPEPEPDAAPVIVRAVASSDEDTGPIPQPEPPPPPAPVAHDDRERERVVAPPPASKPDGTYTLIAYPFVRFSDLGQFQGALQKLAGVHDVQVRRFAQGTLEMHIGYSGTTDLATVLRTLATEIEDVREDEPYQLRVRLRASQDS